MLSGYEIMWLFVMFDLPVVGEADRKNATQFRKELLDYGFSMTQFSVYTKVVPGKEKAERLVSEIGDLVPPAGRVAILTITDKQYAKIVSIEKGLRDESRKKPQQLVLI